MQKLIATVARLASHRATRHIAQRFGDTLGMVVVAEHPRSGGTWIAHMVGDYLDMAFPKHSMLPVACRAVHHTHLGYSPRFPRSVLVIRDGRDVVVSSFFYVAKTLQRSPSSRLLRRMPVMRGITDPESEIRSRLPEYIEQWCRRPFGCPTRWDRFTKDWFGPHDNVVVTHYEAMRKAPHEELAKVLTSLTSDDVCSDRVMLTVNKYDFTLQTGRKPGDSLAASNKRKGIVGDWRNYFSRDSAERFNQYCGEALIEFGYEVDAEWVESVVP